jgi:hypothetical protein
MSATTFTDLEGACAYLSISPAAVRMTIEELRNASPV